MTDPVQDLVHDHADLNRRVLALGTTIRALDRDDGNGMALALVTRLGELREMMFLHFAREEEGLFPYVAEIVPELVDQVQAMAVAHDAICGALARMYHLSAANADIGVITQVFNRFETAYASHAEIEADFLNKLTTRLAPEQLDRLSELVHGL